MFCPRSEGCEFESHLDQTQWYNLVSDLKKYISLCISQSESLCDRDYPPDHLDQKLG